MVRVDAEMTCRELVELVTAWFDGALPATDRARFDAHLRECPYCRIYLEQVRQAARLLGGLSEASVDSAAQDALLACFRDWRGA